MKIVDTAHICLQKRFECYDKHNNIFGFLYDLNKLKLKDDSYILKCCKDLQLAIEGDIYAMDLYEEIKFFMNIVPENITALELLKHIIKTNLSEIYPNLITSLQILLTTPVTVASAERSFSKLKIIKNYLRSTISQDMLSSLSIMI